MSLNLETVWQIMKEYDFRKENKIENNLLCTLCKKLMINAHISPCKCRFCFDCISNYLNKEKKSCPGNTDRCKMKLISLNENITVDCQINNKVSKLIVKCPEISCIFTDELRNIENHIIICNNRSVSCPYLSIGCNSFNTHDGNVVNHLQLEIQNHTKLLIDCIDNLKKEIVELKIIVDKLEKENKNLTCTIDAMKLCSKRKQKKCVEQDREINLLNQDMVALRNVDQHMGSHLDELEMDGKKKQLEIDKLNKKLQEIESKLKIEKLETIDLLNNKIDRFRDFQELLAKEVNKLELDGKRNQESIGTLEKKCENYNKQIEQFNNKYQQNENKIVNAKQERKNNKKYLMRNIDEMKNKQNEMTTMSNEIDGIIKNIENKLLEMEINQNKMNYGEFLWKIDKINDKMKDAKSGINTIIYSDSFYTHKHGYKMCLSLCPDGFGGGKKTHLSVFFHLMKGEFDDILQWQFRNDVTFSLINQQTGSADVSWTIKYDIFPSDKDLNKPINERNDAFGNPKFVELKELSTKANLILNNQIFIKFSVNIST